MSGPSTLVLCRRCGWERPYEWFLTVEGHPVVHYHDGLTDLTGVRELLPGVQRVKECRACRDGRYDGIIDPDSEHPKIVVAEEL